MELYERYQKEGFPALVEHSFSLDADNTIERAYQVFSSHDYRFVGVVDKKKLVGVASREEILNLVSGRYGFNLFAKKPITTSLCEKALIIKEENTLSEVLDLALMKRSGLEAHEDIILANKHNHFIGVIPTQSLVRLQHKMMELDRERIEAQRLAIEEKNQNLFENLEALRTSQGKWHSLFSNNPLAIALANEDGGIDDFNPCFREMFGNLLVAADGRKPSILDLAHSTKREALRCCIQDKCRTETISDAQGCDFEFRHPTRMAPRTVRIVVSAIPETHQTALLLEDVTTQRELERSVANKEKSAMLDSLVGGIAHELNNKLSPILGFLSMHDLEEGNTFDLNSIAGIIREATEDAARIIRQLLDLSRPPAVDRSTCDLRELTANTVELLQFEARKVECRITPPVFDTDNPVFATLDPGQIRQVLINLIVNALHAVKDRPLREIKIDVRARDAFAEISVSDTGTGIPPERLERIFEPFYTTKATGQGTGLGLSVCRNIVRLHDGELKVASIPDEGTRFTLQLPLAYPNKSADEISELARVEKPVASSDLKNLKCLVVDDEPYVSAFLTKALHRELGMEAVTACNGKNAIESLRSDTFDLVISDIRMPEVDGFELLEWICENEPELTNRFLFITGDAGGQNLEEKLQGLEKPFLRKPFVIDDLSQACTRIFAKQAMEELATVSVA